MMTRQHWATLGQGVLNEVIECAVPSIAEKFHSWIETEILDISIALAILEIVKVV